MKNNSCIMIPTIKKNGKEYGSKLFSDLSSVIKNKNLVVSIYSIAISTVDEFDKNELDEFGEPKIESVLEKYNIGELFKNELSTDAILESIGLMKSGKRVYFNSYEDITNKISAFNKNKKNKLVIIKNDDNGYYGEIVADTQENIDLVEHQEYVNSLNKKMKLILNKLGFNVQRIEGLQDAGIFSPEEIDKTADELINIIKLSKGIEGDYAFTEEFSHFLVAGLRRTELINRLLNTLNLDSIREILNDEYESYYNKYKNKTSNNDELLTLLKEEVAGKLLAERLNNNVITKTGYDSLWERFENYIKNNFKDKNQNEILDVINKTKEEFDQIRNDILSNDEPNFFKDFDSLQVEISKDLYKIKNDFSKKFININNEILKINAQKKQLFSVKGDTSLISKEDTKLDEYLRLDENLKETEKLISEKQYSLNCMKFLEQVKKEMDDFFKEEKIIINELEKNENNKNSFVRIGKLCGVLNNIKDFLDSYLSVTNDLMNLNTKKEIPLRTEISNLASLVNKSLIKMKKSYSDLQYDLVYYWLKTYYWKTNPKIKTTDGEIITLTLESMLREAPRDIDVIDTWVSEMGHCSDPLLNLVSTIHKKAIAQRDIQLEDVHNRLSRIYIDLGGGPTDFMYEVRNGKLTGRFKSKYDFDKFNNERRKFIKSIDEKKTEAEKRLLIQKWDGLHTMKVLVDPNAYNGSGRYEKVPNIIEYPQYRIDDWDAGMTEAQKKYYDEIMLVKAEMETNLNFSNHHLYLAPQVTTDYLQALTSDKNLKDTAKSAFAKAKRTFIKDVSDIEYGEINENGEINVITNMHGDPIKKVPVYFVNKITDTNRLNTDCTKCMAAYSAMALNFKEMNKIINQIETLKELAFDRDVKQYKGNNLMVNNIKTGNGIIEEVYTKKGKDTNIGKRLDKYIDMNFYGMQKEEGNSIQLFGCEISLAKFSDWIKDYSGVVNLGLNTFSAVSNINVGEVQLIIEAMANSGLKLFMKGKKHTFGIKDLIQAHAIYLKELPMLMAEMGNPLKNNYLSLMMKKYDTEQTFFEDVKNDGYYNNAMERIVGNNSLGYCLQNAGEHFLHGILMIAMLKAKKVLVDGVEMSLYDAYKVEDNKLVEKGEIRDLDGNLFTKNKFIEEKLRIQEISHQLNGAFSAEDLGSLHSKAILRLAAQFRQWMPGHWGRRFASSYINTATGEQLEGYWYTAYKLVRNLSIAIRKDKTNIATVFAGLNDYEKLNLLKVLSEISLMFILSLLIKGAFAGEGDDDDEIEYGGGHFGGGGASGSWDDGESMSRPVQFYKYQLKRTYMEMASTMPIMPIAMGENLFTMLQSPAAAIKSCNNLLNVFCLWNLGDEIQSGKYEGWSVYRRDLLNAIPYFSNIRKYYDLATEKYMFNIFP